MQRGDAKSPLPYRLPFTGSRSNSVHGCRWAAILCYQPKEFIMKTSTLLKGLTLTAALTAVLSASVLAQNGPGPGAGMGAGMGAGPGAGQMGPGAGMRGMRFDSSNTPGWALMTAEERTAQQTQMRAVKTYEECNALRDKQHQAMQERAKEKGVTLMVPRQNVCDRMKARGWIK
jgi:hypothetical protein